VFESDPPGLVFNPHQHNRGTHRVKSKKIWRNLNPVWTPDMIPEMRIATKKVGCSYSGAVRMPLLSS
jgi:hypothetical protein